MFIIRTFKNTQKIINIVVSLLLNLKDWVIENRTRNCCWSRSTWRRRLRSLSWAFWYPWQLSWRRHDPVSSVDSDRLATASCKCQLANWELVAEREDEKVDATCQGSCLNARSRSYLPVGPDIPASFQYLSIWSDFHHFIINYSSCL